MTPQGALTQRASQPSARMTRAGLRGVQNVFDSGLWEPDDPMHGVEGNFRYYQLFAVFTIWLYDFPHVGACLFLQKMIWIIKIWTMVMATCTRMTRPGLPIREVMCA